ncbi:hypothetical protein [Cellulomonas sp. Y8]|uniref:hypothetical protein n=1 Tax=Cellulomonas sp. Y8 TaxID=2591145 RepID=UPI003D719B7C
MLSGTARAGLGFTCMVVVLATLAAWETSAVQGAVGRALDYRASGASTVTLAAPGRIDAAACHQLADLPGVDDAGAIRRAGTDIVPATLPHGTVPTYDVTPRFGGLLDAEVHGESGLLLSDQAAVLSSGREVTLLAPTGAVAVAGTFSWPRDGRRPGFGYAAMQLSPATGIYDECWVHAWPMPGDLANIVQTTLIPARDVDDQPAVLSQLNTTLGTRFTGGETFDVRPTRHAPALAAALGAAIGYAAVRVRRVQLAGALHDGLTRASLLVIVGLEACAWVLPAAVTIAAATIVVAGTGPPEAASATVGVSMRVAAAAAMAALLGALTAAMGARERQLVRYVRDR